jgi:hypothetical protein
MQDITVAGVQEHRLPSHTSIKINVLREILIRDRQNIPCATLKRRGPWIISFISGFTCINAEQGWEQFVTLFGSESNLESRVGATKNIKNKCTN